MVGLNYLPTFCSHPLEVVHSFVVVVIDHVVAVAAALVLPIAPRFQSSCQLF